MVDVYKKIGNEFVQIGIRDIAGKFHSFPGFPEDSKKTKIPGHSGDETSFAAAKDISSKAENLRQQVFSLIEKSGDQGMTVFELIEQMKLIKDTIAPRVSELRQEMKIFASNDRRQSPSGKRAIVWKIMSFDIK